MKGTEEKRSNIPLRLPNVTGSPSLKPVAMTKWLMRPINSSIANILSSEWCSCSVELTVQGSIL